MLYLYDDALARRAEPFALTRPWGEVRAGGLLVRERWEHVFGMKAAGFVGAPHLARFSEFDSPPPVATGTVLPAGSVIVNTRFAPVLAPLGTAAEPTEPSASVTSTSIVGFPRLSKI